MNPLISIIVPIYNVEKYLDRCIESIVNQSYKNLEIILIDDGSLDNCPQICDKWTTKDNRIIVIHKENGGLSDARNVGLDNANGDYVSFVDSDDWIDREFINTLIKTMLENQCDLVECDYFVTDRFTKLENQKLKTVSIYNSCDAMKLHLKGELFKQVVWNKLYKRSLIVKKFEKGKYHEDEFWTYQIIGHCKKLGHINSPLYFYYQRTDSIVRRKYFVERLDIVEALYNKNIYIKQNYPFLQGLSQKEFIDTCLYQSQLLIRSNNKEYHTIIKKICNKARNIGKDWKDNSNITWKYKIWFNSYFLFPVMICKIRNFLRIGL